MIRKNSKTLILLIVFLKLVSAQMDSRETKSQLKHTYVSLLKNIVDVNEKRMIAMKKLNDLQEFILTKNKLSKLHGLDLEEDYSTETISDQNSMMNFVDMRNNLNLTLRKTYSRQEAANSNINIIIPVNSFNIKSDYIKNDQNGEGSVNKHNILDKIQFVNYKTESRTKTQENLELFDDSSKIFSENDDSSTYSTNKDNDQIDVKNDENYKEINSKNPSRKNWKGSCNKDAVKNCKEACVDAHKNGCMIYKCSRQAKKAFSKECKRSCRDKFLSGRYSDGDSDWE